MGEINNKIVVVYKSKYGSTKLYASWIAQSVQGDLIEYNKANLELLKSYDVIIFGGYLYMGKIAGIKLIEDNIEKLKDKKIVIFSIGALKSGQDLLGGIKEKILSNIGRTDIEFFYMRGAYNYSKLSLVDKLLMKGLISSIKKKKEEDRDEASKDLLEFCNRENDWTKKNNIKEIVDYII